MSWEKVRLGDVCRIEKGTTGITKALPGSFPLVVTSEERKSHCEFQFDDDAVIIPLVSSTGHGKKSLNRIHFQQGKFALGSILCAVIPKDKSSLNAEYLYRYLDFNKEKELVSRMRGMANVSLPMNEIANIEIPLPPIEVQVEFSKKYKDLEDKSDLIDSEFSRQLSLLQSLRRQILQEAVSGKLVPQDPADEPASVLLERIRAEKEQMIRDKKIKKEKPLPPIKPEEIPFEIPGNWVWCRLGEICSKITDGFHNTPPKLKQGIPYISATHVKSDKIDWKNCDFVAESFHKELFAKAYPQKGELLVVNIGAGCGTPAIIDVEYEFSFKNTAILKFLQERISNKFLFCYFMLSKDKIYKTLTQGGLQPFLSLNILKSIVLPLPSTPEQHRIVAKVEELMKVCDEMEKGIKNNKITLQKLQGVVLKENIGAFDH